MGRPKGSIAWNKGLGLKVKCICKKCECEFFAHPNRKRKYCSRRCVGDSRKGFKFPKEWRIKISNGLMGNTNGRFNVGRIISKETRLKISKKVKQNYIDRPELRKIIKEKRKLQKPTYESKHEKLVQSELRKHKIPFKKHRYMKEIYHAYQCDIFIEPDLVIEIDGSYWHDRPETKKMDEIRNIELGVVGFKVLRFDALSIMDKNYKINQGALNHLIDVIKYERR